MSGAIFGRINLLNKTIEKNIVHNMMDKLDIYKLDSKKTLTFENLCMGCGLLHITEEDSNEVLPFYDKVNNIFITADAILDNREELIKLLKLQEADRSKITDSQLILKAYIEWKEECPKYLLGDYAFVIYDKTSKKIMCATDYTGCRTLYYKLKDNEFYFSTVIEPIYDNESINERWLSDFIELPGVMHHSESEETVYSGIQQIPAATVIIVSADNFKKIKYWDPLKDCKRIKLNSDNEYVEEFKKIFTEAVKCRLRTNHNIGISMSGGLDSSSVACIAAPMLKERNKKIISFTSIPNENYIDTNPRDRISNESEYVKLIGEKYNNIEINYCRSEGLDSLSVMDSMIKFLEMPYKTFQNSYWCIEIMDRLYKKDCKVVLTGQFGNFTISYGDFFTNMKTLIKDKRYIKFIKEIIGCSRLHNISYLYTLKYVIKYLNPYNLYSKLKRNKNYKNNVKSLINKKLLSKWNIEERFLKKKLVMVENESTDMYEERLRMADSSMFTQISNIETKLSLYNGVLQRDPTKDKRVIEFCFGLDGDQYVRNGLDRFLIRRAVKDVVPDEIRSLQGIKGFQGADWIERLLPKQKEIVNILNACICDEMSNKYLNMDYIKNQVDLLKMKPITDNSIDIKSVLMAINLYKFFNNIHDEVSYRNNFDKFNVLSC